MKLNYKRTVLIGMVFLTISAFWQMYDNVVPLILKNTFHMALILIRIGPIISENRKQLLIELNMGIQIYQMNWLE